MSTQALSNNQKELLALIKFSTELPRLIARMISDGTVKTVAQGADRVAGAPEVAPAPVPVEKQVGQISKIWEKVSDDAKRAFVNLLKEEGFI